MDIRRKVVNGRMDKQIEELTLLLLYLTAWNEEGYYFDQDDQVEKTVLKHSWKGYSFDALNALTDQGYLFDGKHRNKSVTLTKEGELLAQELIKKYIKDEN